MERFNQQESKGEPKSRANPSNFTSFFSRLSESTQSYAKSTGSKINSEGGEIFVKGRKFAFTTRDNTFFSGGNAAEKSNADCELCGSKASRACGFCGKRFCTNCCFKLRNESRICMICDRKFIAKDLIKVFEEMSEKKEFEIKKQEMKLKSEKEMLEEVQGEINELYRNEERIQHDFEIEMEESAARKEVVENRIREMTNENELLIKRINLRNEETSKLMSVHFLQDYQGLNNLEKKYEEQKSKQAAKNKNYKEEKQLEGTSNSIYDSQNSLSTNGNKPGRLNKRKVNSTKENVKNSMIAQHENCGKCMIF